MKSGNLKFLEPSGPLQACNGTALPLPFTLFTIIYLKQTVSTVCSVATVLCSQYMVRAMLFHIIKVLYFYISTFRNMCAVYGIAVFCNSLMSCVSGMLIRYFVRYFNVPTVAPIITGITFNLKFHILCISVLTLNPLNAELNPICHLLALLGGATIVVVSR